MSKIEEILNFIKVEAEKFGARNTDEITKSYVIRNNTNDDALNDKGGYFGFIHSNEEAAGPFHDFSITVFPAKENLPWLLCLGVGILGYKNDYENASIPGIRRLFGSLINDNGYCKTSLMDVESPLPKNFTNKLPHLKNSIQMYTKVLPVCQIITDPLSDEGKSYFSAFVAAYAKIRNWSTNKSQRDAIKNALEKIETREEINDLERAHGVLKFRKFLILEGAPGTGKTRLAKKLADKINGEIFFTQFHAETSYQDFIYGIKPKLNVETVSYEPMHGIFYDAI